MDMSSKTRAGHHWGTRSCPTCGRSNARQFLFECSCGCTHKITERQLQVLNLLADGYDNRAIAAALFVSNKGAENYVTIIYKILTCLKGHRRVAAGLWYQQHCLGEKDEENTGTTFSHRSPGVDGLRAG